MQTSTTQFVDFPPDVLLQIFSECNVFDLLRLSATCKRLRQMSEEHQTWSDQAKQTQHFIPHEATISTTKLKDLVISRAKVDANWVSQSRSEPHQYSLDVEAISSHFLPGGKFVVLVHRFGDLSLKEIQDSDSEKWNLVDVTRYQRQDDRRDYPSFWSKLLTETSYGCPAFVYMSRNHDKLFVLLIDHVSREIKEKEPVDIGNSRFRRVWEILAVKNKVFCCREEYDGWGILVVQLNGLKPIQKHFALQLVAGAHHDAEPSAVRFFSISENGIVVCHPDGIHLYHVPELESADNDTVLAPTWSWSGKSTEYHGSVYDVRSEFPKLSVQGSHNIHELEFSLESGLPAVLRHEITGMPPVWACVKEWGSVQKGRKWARYYKPITGPPILVCTLLMGGEGKTGTFSLDLFGSYGKWEQVKHVDVDEATGRFLFGVGGLGPFASKLWLMDTSA